MSSQLRCAFTVFTLLAGAAVPVKATEFFVSPSASSGGSGTRSNPWTLSAAIKSGTVQPGDTITLDGGTYVNPTNGQDAPAWVCTLQGTASKPIILRSSRGARAVLDGANTIQEDVFRVSSNYVWYVGLEIMSSDPGRVDQSPQTDANDLGSYPSTTYIKRGQGINISSGGSPTGNKFINCIVHDCNGGFNSTNTNDNSQLYGCLFYNNGWYNSGGGGRSHHGHNIYIHNATGEIKQFYDCITWGAFENNIQAWSGSSTSNQEINDFFFDGHVSFLYGSQVDGCGLILGNQSPTNPTLTNSMFYVPSSASPTVMLGYSQGSGTVSGGNISNNYIYGGEVYFNASPSGLTFNNNLVSSGYIRGSAPSGSGNTVTSSKPTANKVFIRPNQYEAGRANVIVYNWQGNSSVTVDLSAICKSGDTYNIVDVQNPSAVLLSGTYSGPVSIPMTGTAIAQPIGNDTEGRTHTPSEFGCFIVSGGSGSVPVSNPPLATTGSAGSVTVNGAQLNGSVNPQGSATTYHFEYGPTTSYGSSTSSASAGSGTGSSSYSATMSGLSSATLYHYRIVASSSAGTANGSDATFTTSAPAPTPPAAATSAATNVTATGAQLNGSVNPNGVSTTYHFEYGVTTSYGSSTSSASAGGGSSSSSYNTTLSGLLSATAYHYRIVAASSAGTTNGSDFTFTTNSPAATLPVATTSAPTSITATGVQLNGSVNPNGVSTTFHFEYGLTSAYGLSTSPAGAGNGTASTPCSAALNGLASGAVFHYRIVAGSSAGTSNGQDTTFTTLVPTVTPPVVAATTPTNVSTTGAQLNGTVNPNGVSTTYHFEYGAGTSYGLYTPTADAGSGTSGTGVNAAVTGLTPGTLYHYRLVAANSGGSAHCSDGTFTTAAPPPAPAVPVVKTLAAKGITATRAQLEGTVNPNGSATTYHFEYGPTAVYGSSTPAADAGAGTGTVSGSFDLKDLTPGSVHHCRIVATNAGGTVTGADTTFTQQPLVTPPHHGRDPHVLAQNFPNPFNPSTQIAYDLLVASDVSLKVYNALGVEVANLVTGFQEAGTHLAEWDGKGLVSGIYFCVLKSGGMVSTRRMLLLK
jgi:hypothetical protein